MIDAATGKVLGTVPLGGDAGNVFSDAGARQMLVDDQSNNSLDAIDPATLTITRRIDYVAAESGWVTVLDRHGRGLTVTGRAHLADGAHVVAVDPVTHRSYFPIPSGPDGRPVLLIEDPLR